MKKYYKQDFGLIKDENGRLFVAHGSDDLFNRMSDEIGKGESVLVQPDYTQTSDSDNAHHAETV